jgi:DNA mismatch endonuclease (patch repair protein)
MARKAAHRLGLRFRLHRADLPGCPDFVLPKHRVAVFVHGCFWHGHGCRRSKLPQTNANFWKQKVAKNRIRDKKARVGLKKVGWHVLTLWQCQLRDIESAKKLIRIELLKRRELRPTYRTNK